MSPGVAAILDRIEIRDRAGFVRERREELTIACVFQHPINIGMLVPNPNSKPFGWLRAVDVPRNRYRRPYRPFP
jgi:hypothetical protein